MLQSPSLSLSRPMASNSAPSTSTTAPTSKKAKSKKAKNERKRHDGLEAPPLMVLDRPADISGAIPKDRISIQNLMYIGSYSWVDSADPTIVVPGIQTLRSREVRMLIALMPYSQVHQQSGATGALHTPSARIVLRSRTKMRTECVSTPASHA